MPQILDAKNTTLAFKKLIENSNKYCYLISPYIKLDVHLYEIIQAYPYDLNVICGKNIDQVDTVVVDFVFGNLYYCQNLHAKIYLSEKSAIVSSMNLYDYSYKNNHEISVLFDRSKHPEQWNKIYQQVKVIKNASTREW